MGDTYNVIFQPPLRDMAGDLLQIRQFDEHETGGLLLRGAFLRKGQRHLVRIEMFDVMGRINGIDRAIGDRMHIGDAGDNIRMNVGVDVQPDFPPALGEKHGRRISPAPRTPQPTYGTSMRSCW